MNNFELLRKYRKLDVQTTLLFKELNKNIYNFFNDYDELSNHSFEVLINSGKYIVLTDYVSLGDSHVPLDILYSFCDEFGVELESISHECSVSYERGSDRRHYMHGNVYTICFEIIKEG